MSNASTIEWTNATWNPVSGCTRVSAGCDHCYAVAMTHRLEKMGRPKYAGLTVLNPRGDRHFNGMVRCDEDALTIPLRWRKPRRIFVNSMSDLFHRDVPDRFIRMVFAIMSYAGQHTFQVLTKRPERMAEWFADEDNSLSMCQAEYAVHGVDPVTPTGKSRIRDTRAINGHRRGLGDGNYWPLPNVWLGASCENQAAADERIPHLLRCPAAVRFLSCEPLLGTVELHLDRESLTDVMDADPARSPYHRGRYPFPGLASEHRTRRRHNIGWVIVGGESGAGARACDVAWIRGIVEQCRVAAVPCFVKQIGARPVFGVHAMGDPCIGKWYEPTIGDDFDTHHITDKKGGDPAEWPADLRVREMPRSTP